MMDKRIEGAMLEDILERVNKVLVGLPVTSTDVPVSAEQLFILANGYKALLTALAERDAEVERLKEDPVSLEMFNRSAEQIFKISRLKEENHSLKSRLTALTDAAKDSYGQINNLADAIEEWVDGNDDEFVSNVRADIARIMLPLMVAIKEVEDE